MAVNTQTHNQKSTENKYISHSPSKLSGHRGRGNKKTAEPENREDR